VSLWQWALPRLGTHWLNYVTLFVVVFHSWVTGLLVTQFSSVFRAVADGIPVLLLHFLLDPLASQVPLAAFQSAYNGMALPFPPRDWARNYICLLLPLSGMTFSFASAEMQKAVDAMEKPGPLPTSASSSDARAVYSSLRSRSDPSADGSSHVSSDATERTVDASPSEMQKIAE